MLKKLVLVTGLASMLFVAGCSNSNNGTSETLAEQDSQSQVVSDSDSYTIWIPGDEVEYKFYFDMFENYKEHMEEKGETFEYTIEQQPWSDYWTKLPLEISEGRGPDMYLAHDAYMDMLIPISQELDLGEDILSKLELKGQYLGDNGKDIFVPTVLVSYVMFANTELAADDSYPTTWSELIEDGKVAMENNPGVIGFDYNFNILSDLLYNDGAPYTKDNAPSFEKEQLEELLNFQNVGISDYLMYGNGSPDEVFNQNAAAYIHGATWMEFWAPEEIKEKMVAFPVPRNEDDSNLAFALTEPTFGISKNVEGEKYNVLNDFVKFMLTDEKTISDIAKGNSGICNNTDITVSYEPLTAGDAVTKTFENREISWAVVPRDLEKLHKENLEKVLAGEDIDSVINNAYNEAEKISVNRLSNMESVINFK